MNTGQFVFGAVLFAFILSLFGTFLGVTAIAVGWISGGTMLALLGVGVFVVSLVVAYLTTRWFLNAA